VRTLTERLTTTEIGQWIVEVHLHLSASVLPLRQACTKSFRKNNSYCRRKINM